MLIDKKIVNGSEICVFDSENIMKSIYYKGKETIMIYFIRKRKSKDIKTESKDQKKILLSNKKDYLEGMVYNILNFDEKTYDSFISASSQGKYFNEHIVKNPKYYVSGKIELFGFEIKETVELVDRKEKGFLF